MKKTTMEIRNCDDCPFYESVFVQCSACSHAGSYWKCFKTGKLADDGWETIPDWCPLEDADDKKD